MFSKSRQVGHFGGHPVDLNKKYLALSITILPDPKEVGWAGFYAHHYSAHYKTAAHSGRDYWLDGCLYFQVIHFFRKISSIFCRASKTDNTNTVFSEALYVTAPGSSYAIDSVVNRTYNSTVKARDHGGSIWK